MPNMNSSALDGAFCVLVSTIATWVRYDGIAGEVQLSWWIRQGGVRQEGGISYS
jgi:hypothetical protein